MQKPFPYLRDDSLLHNHLLQSQDLDQDRHNEHYRERWSLTHVDDGEQVMIVSAEDCHGNHTRDF